MNSLVSVIVPVYNVEEYMDKCVETIVNQTYQNLEIILIDDGSSDSCPQKCDRWTEKDARIQVIHKKNGGVGFARNTGLELARGDFVTFVDSDDYLANDAIEVMLERIELDQSDLVIAQCVKVYPDGSADSPAYPWISDKTLSKEDVVQMVGSAQALPIYAWGKLYRSHIFNKVRYTSLTCAEDVYILPEILEICKRVSLVEKVLYYYYQRLTSTVHSRKAEQIIDSILAAIHVSRYLLEQGCTNGASRYYYSAVCESYELENRTEAKHQIQIAFNAEEKKQLRKAIDRNIAASMLAAKFPFAYKFYKSHIKR